MQSIAKDYLLGLQSSFIVFYSLGIRENLGVLKYANAAI